MNEQGGNVRRPNRFTRSWVSGLLLFTALILVMALASGLGTRLDWWHYSTGLSLLRWAVYLGLAGLVAAVVSTALSAASGGWGIRRSIGCLLLLSILLALPLSHWWNARTLPVLNDITTDPINPPEYRIAPETRTEEHNPIELPEPEQFNIQREAYPNVRPVRIETEPARAFVLAEYTARALGWDVVYENSAEGLIEAVDRTFWFGFEDDVVLRIREINGASRIDLRSSSRVGRHDIGQNARRIKRYLRQVERQAGETVRYLEFELPADP